MSIPWAWLPVTKTTSGHKGAALGWQRKIPVSGRGHLWRGVPALGSEQGGHPWTWLCLTHETRRNAWNCGRQLPSCVVTWPSGLLRVFLSQGARASEMKGYIFDCVRQRWQKAKLLTYWGCFAGQRALGLEPDTRVPALFSGPSLTFSVAISLCRRELISAFWVLIVKWDICNKKCVDKIFYELKMHVSTSPCAPQITLHFSIFSPTSNTAPVCSLVTHLEIELSAQRAGGLFVSCFGHHLSTQ